MITALSERTQVQLRALDRRTLTRATCVGFMLLIYYALDWIQLRQLWREIFCYCLATIGHEPRSLALVGGPGFSVDGRAFSLSRNCTYVDLMLVLAPLLWMPALPFVNNLARMLGLVATVSLLNVLRVTSAIHLHIAAGFDWLYVHFWPDYLCHFGVIIWVAASTLLADWRSVCEFSE